MYRGTSVVFLLIALLLNGCRAEFQTKCPQSDIDKADKCAEKGFFLMDDDYDGQGSENIDQYCGTVNDSLTCVQAFNKKCLKGFASNAANMGISGLKKHHKTICVGKKPKRKEFIEKTKWLKKQQINVLSPCVQASIKNFHDISVSTQSKLQIPEACCNYVLTRECLKAKTKQLTTQQNLDFIESMTDDALGDLISFVCTNNSNMKQCRSKNKSAMQRMRAVYKTPPAKGNYESILIPFLNILTD